MRARLLLLLVVFAFGVWPAWAAAEEPTPATQAERIRSSLVQTQLDIERDTAAAHSEFATAQAAYAGVLQTTLERELPPVAMALDARFAEAQQALEQGDPVAFAAARTSIWTTLLNGSYHVVQAALQRGDLETASAWLPLREYRTATRFARPNADATLAFEQLRLGKGDLSKTLQALHADVLDTYQSRLDASLRQLQTADTAGYPSRRAEFASTAAGYFEILAPAYREQRGESETSKAISAFDALRTAALSDVPLDAPLQAVQAALNGFRAAPLSPSDQARRAGQLLRFLKLVPVEYSRGVRNGQVTQDLEIQEAVTFHSGAVAAFADLQPLLAERDPAATSAIAADLKTLETQLAQASSHSSVVEPDVVQTETDSLLERLKTLMPVEWTSNSLAGDFDVITSVLDRMEQAAAAGEYELAESARLEAYAVLESGPEARLIVFAPQYKAPIEDLFWYGQGEQPGLARLIRDHAPIAQIRISRKALDTQLSEAQAALGGSSAPGAVASNAAIIVFREGLEAVLILASLLASLKLGEQRKLRKPIWIGAVAALAASVLTWILARGILQMLARYGEKLEAIVSLIAIGVLLLITNWFFHKVYWTGWMANFHARKRRLIGGNAGLWLGLIMLGFTSIYREGFETVLFLQALVLEAGSSVVLGGVGIGLGGTFLVGLLVFVLQARLPHKKMLIVTGVMIGAVLLVMVGNTVHVLQVVGWMPLHPIRSLQLPYWTGMWFGMFATWEGLLSQVAAGAFVIGSYYLAEYFQHRKSKQAIQHHMQNA